MEPLSGSGRSKLDLDPLDPLPARTPELSAETATYFPKLNYSITTETGNCSITYCQNKSINPVIQNAFILKQTPSAARHNVMMLTVHVPPHAVRGRSNTHFCLFPNIMIRFQSQNLFVSLHLNFEKKKICPTFISCLLSSCKHMETSRGSSFNLQLSNVLLICRSCSFSSSCFCDSDGLIIVA